MQEQLRLSDSNSKRNCHSWICPLPINSMEEIYEICYTNFNLFGFWKSDNMCFLEQKK